jgi:hypothetical protein
VFYGFWNYLRKYRINPGNLSFRRRQFGGPLSARPRFFSLYHDCQAQPAKAFVHPSNLETHPYARFHRTSMIYFIRWISSEPPVPRCDMVCSCTRSDRPPPAPGSRGTQVFHAVGAQKCIVLSHRRFIPGRLLNSFLNAPNDDTPAQSLLKGNPPHDSSRPTSLITSTCGVL